MHMQMIKFLTPPFLLGPAFFRTPLQGSGGLSPGEGWNAFTRSVEVNCEKSETKGSVFGNFLSAT